MKNLSVQLRSRFKSSKPLDRPPVFISGPLFAASIRYTLRAAELLMSSTCEVKCAETEQGPRVLLHLPVGTRWRHCRELLNCPAVLACGGPRSEPVSQLGRLFLYFPAPSSSSREFKKK